MNIRLNGPAGAVFWRFWDFSSAALGRTVLLNFSFVLVLLRIEALGIVFFIITWLQP